MRSLKRWMILAAIVMLVMLSMDMVWAASAKLAENMSVQEVSEMLKKDSKIKVIDVRTQTEFQFNGYIKGAHNVPYWFMTKKFMLKDQEFEYESGVMQKAPINRYQFTLNQDFMKYVKELAKPDDTVVVYCGTSGRSAKAADDMVKAGYKDVINMLGGLEEKDGWKNADLPLDYMMKVKDLDPKYVYPPDRP